MTQRTLSLPISGMHCAGCEAVITTAVKELPGVETVSADHRANKVKIRFDDALVSPSTILAYIESKGDSSWVGLRYEVQHIDFYLAPLKPKENIFYNVDAIEVGRERYRHVDFKQVSSCDNKIVVGILEYLRDEQNFDANCCPSKKNEAMFELSHGKIRYVRQIRCPVRLTLTCHSSGTR
jgi:copper chaperone CopZ